VLLIGLPLASTDLSCSSPASRAPWTSRRGTKATPADGDHLLFTFLTTDANAVVAAIHPKAMPVLLLDAAARETWLTESIDVALRIRRPAPDDAVQIVADGTNQHD